jgi:hypothetical protein
MRTDFVLDPLEQALYARQPKHSVALVHHSDRGSQYVSLRYRERLAEAGVEPSVSSKGDNYDNALVETINRLYKAELIHRRAPWETNEAVELATLAWASSFNHHHLLQPLGYIPLAEAEANDYKKLSSQALPARFTLTGLHESRVGTVSWLCDCLRLVGRIVPMMGRVPCYAHSIGPARRIALMSQTASIDHAVRERSPQAVVPDSLSIVAY